MKKQEKLKNTKKKIEVAYFWNEKDDSKIEMIMTKTQVLYPEEKIGKAIKAMIRKIKKLKNLGAGDLKDIINIIEGEKDGYKGKESVSQQGVGKGLPAKRVPKKK